MKTVTGRDVVLSMFDLAGDISLWNKRNTSRAALQEVMAELGLTAHQLEVLGFIKNNPELTTVSEIAAELCISKGSLSLMLSKLQLAGFVQKTAAKGEDDGRKVYVSLTEKGTAAVEKTGSVMVSTAAVAFDNMDETTRALFYTKVKELQELFHTGGWRE